MFLSNILIHKQPQGIQNNLDPKLRKYKATVLLISPFRNLLTPH